MIETVTEGTQVVEMEGTQMVETEGTQTAIDFQARQFDARKWCYT